MHGYIRIQNLIFNHDGYLIDYDLTRLEGSLYPMSYREVGHRHPDAKPMLKTHRIHNRFSLAEITWIFSQWKK